MSKNKKSKSLNCFEKMLAYFKRIHFFEFSFYLIILTFVGCYFNIGFGMMYAIEVTLGMAFMNILYIEGIYYRKLKDLGVTEEDVLNGKFNKEKK